MKNPVIAIKDFNKAISLNPGAMDSYFYRGNCYIELKEYENAILDYDRYEEIRMSLLITIGPWNLDQRMQPSIVGLV